MQDCITKGKKTRQVPLWWDSGTLKDIIAWKAERMQQGANQDDYIVCALSKHAFGKNLSKFNLRHRFQVACRILGQDRLFIGQDQTKTGRKYNKQLTIHHGRHSFCSHALAGGRTLAEVRDAAGHSDISTTSTTTLQRLK
ncbi:tyrosine-type recombinase/integrase [Planctomycetota bacterium]